MTEKREMMTSWHGSGKPQLLGWSDRKKETLMGTARGRRNVPGFRPFDLLTGPNQSVVLLENEDQRFGVESVVGAQQDFVRYCDYDVLYFQFCGTSIVETEFGVYDTVPGELMLVPEGIAHRSIGSPDCLRIFVKLHSPVLEMYEGDKHTGRPEFTLARRGALEWAVPEALKNAPRGKVLERLMTWRDAPDDVTLIDREYDSLVGVASTSRTEKISGIKKIRVFDVFEFLTGSGKGPGPKLVSSEHFMVEVYNTLGDQHSFYRALRSEEVGLQFRGVGTNVSEFDANFVTPPGSMSVVPLGIAHCVENCDEDFLRIVFYSDIPWRVPVDVTNHAFDSNFDVETKVIETASWQRAAAAE